MTSLLRLVLILHYYFIFVIIAENFDSQILLCKNCGQEIFSISDVTYVKSPYALKAWNNSIFHSDNNYYSEALDQSVRPENMMATIQLLKNPHGSTFEIITVKKANFLLLNQTKTIADTWFPNFKWTIGICPHCLVHLGWYFESVSGHENFFAILLDKIWNENFAESLVVQPKFKLY